MIILTGGQKGGTGKSTNATNLAAWFAREGADVLLVDGNSTQGTARKWSERRSEFDAIELKHIECIDKAGNVSKALKDLQKRYDVIIVDTGGQDSKEFRTALLAADLLLAPVAPSLADIETLETVAEMVEQAKDFNEDLMVKIVISQAHTNAKVTSTDDAREILKADFPDFKVLDTVIHTRNSYQEAMNAGAGVIELYPPSNKARKEIEDLAQELFANE